MEKLKFDVHGEDKSIYTISAEIENNILENIICNCQKQGKICEHIVNFFHGNLDCLVSYNILEFINLNLFIRDSRISDLHSEYFEPIFHEKKDVEKRLTMLFEEKLENKINVKNPHKNISKEEVVKELKNFVKKDGLDFGINITQINKLVKYGYLNEISDYYSLKNYRDEIIEKKYFPEKSIDKILNKIEESKVNKNINDFIVALGIEGIGEHYAKLITKKVKTLDELLDKTKDINNFLNKVGLGIVVPFKLYRYFNTPQKREEILKIKELGINFERKKRVRKDYLEEFKGKKILCTGKLAHFTRKEIKEEIEKFGGININTVNQSLDFLIIGEKAGSKLKKAEELGTIQILTEEEFLEVVKS